MRVKKAMIDKLNEIDIFYPKSKNIIENWINQYLDEDLLNEELTQISLDAVKDELDKWVYDLDSSMYPITYEDALSILKKYKTANERADEWLDEEYMDGRNVIETEKYNIENIVITCVLYGILVDPILTIIVYLEDYLE